MIHVAVIVITYRRRGGLVKLLNALQEQRFPDPERRVRLTVIVVDNDAAGSAAAGVEPFRSSKTLAVRYVVEPTQGIPLARNAGISALPDDAVFFCFIDDDEWPGATWVDELLKTQRATAADCILGAVIPVYPEGAPAWLIKSRLFESWRFADQAPLKAAASNNVLISTAFIRRTGHRFDERMRMTGGSDYLFFRQAVALGMRIVWSAGAAVYEDVPASRLTLRWIVQRQYRLGNTFSVSERVAGTRLGVVMWALKGVARVGLGVVMLPALIFSPYYGMRSIIHLIRGAGTVAGAFGQIHREYSPEGVARDRSGQYTDRRV
jgi:glycosyltransferase involved in cell wall biosynthesis